MKILRSLLAAVLLGNLAGAMAADAPALYTQHCASCHGATGRGDGPQAEREVAQGGVWPPMLVGGLLGKRLEGELLWRARHGWSEADSSRG